MIDHPHAFLKINKPEDAPLKIVVAVMENETEAEAKEEHKEPA